MDNFKYTGKWTIISKDLTTGKETKTEQYNAITQGFFTAIHRFLSEDLLIVDNDELNITHLALGETDTPAQRSDTLLGSEYARVEVASKTYTDTLYSVTTYLDGATGNPSGGNIKELGIFTKATATADSGTLISRVAVNINKNANISLTLKWELRGN